MLELNAVKLNAVSDECESWKIKNEKYFIFLAKIANTITVFKVQNPREYLNSLLKTMEAKT